MSDDNLEQPYAGKIIDSVVSDSTSLPVTSPETKTPRIDALTERNFGNYDINTLLDLARALERENNELHDTLQEITDHFADIMSGPLMASVKFVNGVEGIPTIKRARAALAAHSKGERK